MIFSTAAPRLASTQFNLPEMIEDESHINHARRAPHGARVGTARANMYFWHAASVIHSDAVSIQTLKGKSERRIFLDVTQLGQQIVLKYEHNVTGSLIIEDSKSDFSYKFCPI